MSTDTAAALVYREYRVERRTVDGRAVLRVTVAGSRGRQLLADCDTAAAALAVLTQRGVPLDELIYERDRCATVDAGEPEGS